MVAVGLAAMLWAPAVAQTSSCEWIGTQWVCRQEQAPQRRPSPQLNFNTTNPTAEAYRRAEEAGRLRQQDRDERDYQEFRALIGRTIAEGRCADARAAALRAGELSLAAEVDQICAQR